VVSYVQMQLRNSKGQYDRIFSQQNTPEVEAARKRQLEVDVYGDPRRSFYNLLGW
jgi:hypothetical protein